MRINSASNTFLSALAVLVSALVAGCTPTESAQTDNENPSDAVGEKPGFLELFERIDQHSLSIRSIEYLEKDPDYPFVGTQIDTSYSDAIDQSLHPLFFNKLDDCFATYRASLNEQLEIVLIRAPYGNWASSIQVCLYSKEAGKVTECLEAGQFYGDDAYTYEKSATLFRKSEVSAFGLRVWKKDCEADENYENIECVDSLFEYHIEDRIRRVTAKKGHTSLIRPDLDNVISMDEFSEAIAPEADHFGRGNAADTAVYGDYIVLLNKRSAEESIYDDVNVYLKGMSLEDRPLYGLALHNMESSDWNWSFEGMYGKHIILDEGTGTQGRSLYLIDVNTADQLEFSYSSYALIKDNKLFYFTETDLEDSAGIDCPPESEYVRYERCMIYDFEAQNQVQTGQVICLMAE